MDSIPENAQAWDELMGVFFTEEDQQALEWSLGSVYEEGPNKILVIMGDAATGKSTVLSILQGIFTRFCGGRSPVSVRHDGVWNIKGLHENMFVFIASNTEKAIPLATPAIDLRTIEINTTGGKVPRTKLDLLVSQIGSNQDAIVGRCVDTYHNLGPDHYDHELQENQK